MGAKHGRGRVVSAAATARRTMAGRMISGFGSGSETFGQVRATGPSVCRFAVLGFWVKASQLRGWELRVWSSGLLYLPNG